MRRNINKTAIAYGEGDDEEEWLKYLKSIFENPNKHIRIDNGGGGSQLSVLEKMQKRREFNYYDEKYALVDSDRSELQKAMVFAKNNNIVLIVSDQCLEFELLKIIGMTASVSKRCRGDSSAAKREFHKKCKCPRNDYPKLFPKDKIIEYRKRGNTWLDSLLNIFE